MGYTIVDNKEFMLNKFNFLLDKKSITVDDLKVVNLFNNGGRLVSSIDNKIALLDVKFKSAKEGLAVAYISKAMDTYYFIEGVMWIPKSFYVQKVREISNYLRSQFKSCKLFIHTIEDRSYILCEKDNSLFVVDVYNNYITLLDSNYLINIDSNIYTRYQLCGDKVFDELI